MQWYYFIPFNSNTQTFISIQQVLTPIPNPFKPSPQSQLKP